MMYLEEIKRGLADKIIKENHYTHTACLGSQIHLGIFEDNELLGVIQLGWGVNPHGSCKWVKDSDLEDYLELNRVWLDDKLPHNSESTAIGLMFKWLKANRPDVKWLLTFADGLEGNCGTIYQATNWIYTGYNKSGGMWVTHDGQKMHHHRAIKDLPNGRRETLEAHWGSPLYKVSGGQFRYVYFLDKRWRRRLAVESLEYPKASNLQDYLEVSDGGPRRPELWTELQELKPELQAHPSS